MTHIMRINEFFLFKKKENKPKENVKVEKSDIEIFLEKIKNLKSLKYEDVVKEFNNTFDKEFNEKMIQDFKYAKWVCYGSEIGQTEDDVDDMLSLIPIKHYNEIKLNKEYFGNMARFYRFDAKGEHNNLDILVIHAWDYPTKNLGGEEEEEEYTYCLYIAINSKKSNV